ncbi:hypothetical protein Avbf_18668 [Armadillidium vulgare]|nr:hypothetical protein Avbf_18668 [Armadillidium vulgare]
MKVSSVNQGLDEDIDLIKNNAKHGAQIAVEYSKMISSDKIHELSMKEDPGDSQPRSVATYAKSFINGSSQYCLAHVFYYIVRRTRPGTSDVDIGLCRPLC